MGRMVVEIWAAVAGASIGVAASGIKGANRETQHGRDSLVRLTSAVDNLASRMDVLHADLRVRDQELFARISDLEQNVARLEGHANRTYTSDTHSVVMVLLLKPILFSFIKSKAVKQLLLDCLIKISEQTDNQLDDVACKYVKDLLFPGDRVEK